MSISPSTRLFTRRRFLVGSACAAAGLGIYSGVVERHWIEVTQHEVSIPGLPRPFDGFRVAQLSDIHLDWYTEPFFLRDAIRRINELNPDIVLLTGDFITWTSIPKRSLNHSIQQCAVLLEELSCRERYGILGNHDCLAGPSNVLPPFRDRGLTVLVNECLPIERDGNRFWLAGVDDPSVGSPNLEAAIPAAIREIPGEPVILMCHGPDYADWVLRSPVANSVQLMLSGHTHGGQIRMPFLPPMHLPPMGQKYVEGWFHLKNLQLYVNRGLGTVGVPVRFDCPPEISIFTLRSAQPVS